MPQEQESFNDFMKRFKPRPKKQAPIPTYKSFCIQEEDRTERFYVKTTPNILRKLDALAEYHQMSRLEMIEAAVQKVERDTLEFIERYCPEFDSLVEELIQRKAPPYGGAF